MDSKPSQTPACRTRIELFSTTHPGIADTWRWIAPTPPGVQCPLCWMLCHQTASGPWICCPKPVQTPDGVVTSWSQALANGCSCVGFLRPKNSEFVGKLINRWFISDQLVTGLNWKGRDQGENECGNIEQSRVCLPSWSL